MIVSNFLIMLDVLAELTSESVINQITFLCKVTASRKSASSCEAALSCKVATFFEDSSSGEADSSC